MPTRHHSRSPRTPRFSSPEALEARIAPATFTVTTLNDGGAGSLRDAIASANAHAGKDSIVFAAALHGVITLSQGEMEITGPLTINGASKIIIDAARLSRIFNISDASETTDSPVTLSGLTMLNGNASSGSGGTILSLEGLTLSNCTIAGSHANYNGGAVLVSSTKGAVSITNSKFSDNDSIQQLGITADLAENRGGALFVETGGAITIQNSQFNHNLNQFNGGAAYLSELSATSKVSLSNTLFSNNQAGVLNTYDPYGPVRLSAVGGGLYVISQLTTPDGTHTGSARNPVSLTNCQFLTNSASDQGGAVFLENGSPVISGGTYAYNHSETEGGAIAVDGTTGNLTVTNVHLTSNTAKTQGGALYVDAVPSSVLNLSKLNAAGNSSGTEGGAICVLGQPGTGANGKPIATTLNLSSSVFTGNSAQTDGGALELRGGGTAKLTGDTFSGNASTNDGGAMHVAQGVGSVSLVNSSYTGNHASGNVGGGAFEGERFAQLTVSGSKFTGNSASGGAGGGVLISGGSLAVSFTSSSFAENSSLTSGAGLAIKSLSAADAISATISSTSFTENKAASGAGGALLTGHGAVSLTSTNFLRNSGTGAIASGTSFSYKGGMVVGNDSTDGIGGLVVTGSINQTPITISGVSLLQNKGAYTGGLSLEGKAQAKLTNVKIMQNVAGSSDAAGGLAYAPTVNIVTRVATVVSGNANPAAPGQSDEYTPS